MIDFVILALLPCIDFNTMDYHIHVHVEGLDIPAGVGLEPGCFKEMHTHQANGWIHIEGSGEPKHTFKEFLQEWGPDKLKEYGDSILSINGNWTTTDEVLKDLDRIVVLR